MKGIQITIDELINESRKQGLNKLINFQEEKDMSEDDLILRQAGLKNREGKFTQLAHILVENKIMKDHTKYLLKLVKESEMQKTPINSTKL